MRSLVTSVCLLLITSGALADSDKVAIADLSSGDTATYRSAPIAPVSTIGSAGKSPQRDEIKGISGPEARYPTSEILMEEICEALVDAAQSHDLPVPFFARLIWQESRFDPRAVSPAGARGVAQFMPKIAAALQLKDPFNPIAALPVAARFLQAHYQVFGNLGLAAAAYNGGTTRVRNWLAKRAKLSKETRNYVVAITGHAPEQWTALKSLDVPQDLPTRAPCEGIADLSRNADTSRVDVQLAAAVVKLIETAKVVKPGKRRTAKAKSRAGDKAKAKAAPAIVRVAEQIGLPH